MIHVEYRFTPATDAPGELARITDVWTEYGYSRLSGHLREHEARRILDHLRKRALHAENYGL